MKDRIITFTFLILIYLLFVLSIIIPDKDISYEERRYLEEFPTISFKRIINGKFFKDIDDYVVDNFPFRDLFRKVNVFYNLKILRMNDYKNYYIKNNYVFKRELLNEDSVYNFSLKINKLYEEYLTNSSVYLSIIPDKSYYSDNDYLYFNKVEESVLKNLNSNIKYINISDTLNLDSYYYSDIHFRQDKLFTLLSTLGDELGFKVEDNFKRNKYNNFYGSYYGSVAGFTRNDTLTYLSNKYTDKAFVWDLEGKISKVYNKDDLDGIDSYDIFLGGATPLIKINNDLCDNDKELIIFRDSFGSSVTPLIIEKYKSITLIDLRYIDYKLIGDYVDFEKKDILLLYNTTIINNSDIIKVS